jgi:hypothetical protein
LLVHLVSIHLRINIDRGFAELSRMCDESAPGRFAR